VGVIGLFLLFHNVYRSGFQLLVGEYGDGRLSNLFLEHAWQWLVNGQYRGELFSPIFFAPHPHVLALSENLFGTAPLYWLARLVWDADGAFTAWAMGVSLLNYLVMVWVLRRWQVHPGLASLGGLLYGFSLLRSVRLAHVQLLPSCFMPIALYYLWQFLQRPTRRAFFLVLGLSYWQMLSSIYLGWFLMLGLAVMMVLAWFLVPGSGPRCWWFCQTYWRSGVGGLLVWFGAIVWLFAPYVQMKALVGGRSYAEVQSMLPRWQSWLVLPWVGNVWSALLAPFSQGLPSLNEHFIFPGFFTYVLVIGVLVAMFRRLGWLPRSQRALLQVFGGSGLVIFGAALLWPGDWSVWWWVYQWVPGASVIRAVARIAILIVLFWVMAGMVWLDRYLASRNLRRRGLALILSGLFAWNIVEQCYQPVGIPISLHLHDRQETRMVQREMGQILRESCDWGYYALPAVFEPISAEPTIDLAIFPHTYEKMLPPMLIWIYGQTLAMWAGLEANVPVVNGYSGAVPPGLPGFGQTWPLAQTIAWMATQPQKSFASRRFCYLTDRYRPLPTEPTDQPTARLQQVVTSPHYQALVFVPKQN
jgi:hypothetical protein